MAQDYSSLSDNDLKALYNDDYSSISDEGLKTLYKNISDSDTSNTDRNRTVLKGGVEKKVNLRPSNIMNNIVDYSSAAITTPLNMLTKKNDLQTAYNEELQSSKDFRAKQAAEHPIMTNFDNGIKDFAGYALLPAANVFKGAGLLPKVANAALTGGYQGGVIGGIDSLANKGDFLSGAAEGAAAGGALGGAFPLAGGAFNKSKNTLGKLVQMYTGLKPETLKRAVQADSKALDLTEEERKNLMSGLVEQVQDNYNQLLDKRGQAVNKEVRKLNDKGNGFLVDDLQGDVTNIFNQYQKDKVNPARNMTGNLENDLLNLIDSAGSKDDLIKAFKNNINKQKYQGGNLDVQKGRINNKFHTKTLNNENNDIERASRKFNDILDKIKKNPEILNNADEIAKMEQELSQMPVPEDFANDMYNKFYETISNYNDIKNTVSPLSLQGIKEQIGKSIHWSDETARDFKNPILEQLYGRYMGKLSTLSPELAKANKNYAYLRSLQKREGLRKILRPGDNIDTASSALKNYNNTVVKGNTAKNVKELEDILTANGYSPFLNKVDDLNAAQDINLNLLTGRNFGGRNSLARQAIGLGLRGQRALNRRPYLANLYKQLALSNNSELRIPLIYTLGDTIFEDDINEE